MLLLVGQVARADLGRGAFQEVDYARFFADMAKGVWEITDAETLPGIVADAVALAQSGTPGPVVISLPEDMLGDDLEAVVPPAAATEPAPPSREQIGQVMGLLAASERPLVIAGGAINTPEARAALRNAADAHALPVATSFKHQDVFDNAHPGFCGYLGFKIPKPQVDALGKADLILAIGTRLTDATTQNYVLPRAPKPEQPLVHVYADADAMGQVFKTACPVPCDPHAFLTVFAAREATPPETRIGWRDGLHKRAADLARYTPRNAPDGVDFGAVVHALIPHATADTVIVTDAGNFSSWVHRHWPWGPETLLLGAAGGGMGLGMPGAVAAALRFPERQILTFLGDGGALMTGSELATATRQGVAVKVFIANNGSYGTIRQHQEREFPGHGFGTDLSQPDFAKWAEGLGAKGLVIDEGTDIDAVVAEALGEEKSVVVDVRSSVELISAYTSIGEIVGSAG